MSAAHQRYLRELLDKSHQLARQALAADLLTQVPAGCDFGFDDTSDVSAVVWKKEPPHDLLVLRLGSRAGANMPWDFAHELGHVLIGHKPELLRDRAHERAAWNEGWKLIVSLVPNTASAFKDEYERRRDHCLKSYP